MANNNTLGIKTNIQDLPEISPNNKVTAGDINQLADFQKVPVQKLTTFVDTDIIVDGTKEYSTTKVISGATHTITASDDDAIADTLSSEHKQGNELRVLYQFDVDCTLTLVNFESTGNNTGTITPIPAGSYNLKFQANSRGVNLVIPQNAGVGKSLEKDPFTEEININRILNHSPSYAQTTVLNVTKGAGSNYIGGTYQGLIVTDGNDINFTSDFKFRNASDNEYANSGNEVGTYRYITAQHEDGTIGVVFYNTDQDTGSPTIDSFTLNSLNEYVDVTFSEAVSSSDVATEPLIASDLLISNFVAGNATAVSIDSLTKQDGNPLVGGEIVVRCVLDITGVADSTETFEIKANTNSIYDEAGNVMADTETTGTVTLNDLFLFIDTFDGGVISTSNWIIADASNMVSQNNQLDIDHSIISSFDLTSQATFNIVSNPVIVCRFDLTAGITVDGSNNAFIRFLSTNNALGIAYLFSSNSQGNVILNIKADGITVNQTDVGVIEDITTGLSMKEVIDTNAGTIEYFVRSAGVWTQIGVTENSTLANESLRLHINSAMVSSVADTPIVDNMYVVGVDFDTLNP